jgi:hypothetical protein
MTNFGPPAHPRRRWTGVALFIAATLLMTAAPSEAATLKRVDVPIALDARVAVKGTPFTVKFESVSDSRCPPDVDCVWAGQLQVWIRVFAKGLPQKGSARTLIAHPGQPPQKDSVTQLKGWWFGLVDNGNGVVLRIQTGPIP